MSGKGDMCEQNIQYVHCLSSSCSNEIHRLDSLSQRCLFLTVLDPGKPKTKVTMDLMFREGPFSSLQVAVFLLLSSHALSSGY